MVKEYEYFTEFLNNPAPYNNREFHEMLRAFAEYIKEHETEFNYLEDDEWKEIRERIIAEIGKREDIREEFEEITEQFDLAKDYHDARKIKLNQRWIDFMKTHQHHYEFSDNTIAEMQAQLKKFALAVRDADIAETKVKLLKADSRKGIEALDNKLNKYYERTGKRVVLTALQSKAKHKGN